MTCPAAVPGVAGSTANGIAAHFRLAAIGIEDAHGKIGALGGGKQHQPIAADSGVAVADAAGKTGGLIDGLGTAVDEDIVVAAALHFEESKHGMISF